MIRPGDRVKHTLDERYGIVTASKGVIARVWWTSHNFSTACLASVLEIDESKMEIKF